MTRPARGCSARWEQSGHGRAPIYDTALHFIDSTTYLHTRIHGSATQSSDRARAPIACAACFTAFSHGGRAEDHGEHGVGGAPWPRGPSDSAFTVVLRSSSVRKKGFCQKHRRPMLPLFQATTTSSGLFAFITARPRYVTTTADRNTKTAWHEGGANNRNSTFSPWRGV
jgi:hypothetical protein